MYLCGVILLAIFVAVVSEQRVTLAVILANHKFSSKAHLQEISFCRLCLLERSKRAICLHTDTLYVAQFKHFRVSSCSNVTSKHITVSSLERIGSFVYDFERTCRIC